jgi:LacI family transcriptional regulator/LacI family repressor for deo operon, udp, cdd, tsx, nupC, and nupG
MEPKRVTQNDVARAAGVSRPAVTLAFQHNPHVSAATRKRILQVAGKLGYVPDPMLSALSVYSRRQQTPVYQGTLAWLARTTASFDWRKTPYGPVFFQAASATAAELGFRLEAFELGNTAAAAQRLGRMLRARNISGVVVCPLPESEARLDFPWEFFPAIAIGFTLRQPALHAVAAAQFSATALAIAQLHARGYRRIGLCLGERNNRRTAHGILGCYLAEQHAAGCPAHICLTPVDEALSEMKMKAWLQAVKPDAIITGGITKQALAQIGMRIPDELGVVSTWLIDQSGDISGICEDLEGIGRTAIKLLVRQIDRGERGVPKSPHRVLIDSYWHEGASLRPVQNKSRQTSSV